MPFFVFVSTIDRVLLCTTYDFFPCPCNYLPNYFPSVSQLCTYSEIRSNTYDMGNHLAKETSPYLLQHANNPVDWYPWGEEALRRARDENKPILVSIGYAACHWCHVMEKESFENEETAALMNEHFINI